MTEVRYVLPANTQVDTEIIVSGTRIEPGAGVSRYSAKGHVTAVFGQKNSESSVMLDGACPRDLPHRQIRVSVKANQHSTCVLRITDDEPGEPLAIEGIVADPAASRRLFQEPGWLKENSLLLVPEQSQRAQHQTDDYQRRSHARI